MKSIVNFFIITIFIFIFSSCRVGSASNSETESAVEEDDIVNNPDKNYLQYGFDNDMPNHPYKQYIERLKYLEENDLKSRSYYMNFDSEMVEITNNSLSNWDIELNNIYSLLLNKLSTEDAEKLEIEQRIWRKETVERVNKWVEERLLYVEDSGSEDERYAVEVGEAEGYYYSVVYYNFWLFKATKERTLELIHKYYNHDHDIDLAMEAYSAVLRNESVFFSINSTNGVNTHEFFIDWTESTSSRSPIKFTIIDLDGDNVPEIVVSHGVLLHYEDGTVYGYKFGSAEMLLDIKEDGSFRWEGAPETYGYSKYQFFGVLHKQIFLASFDGNNGYEINEVSCLIEEFTAFREAQERKQDVIWYDLNENNIETQVILK